MSIYVDSNFPKQRVNIHETKCVRAPFKFQSNEMCDVNKNFAELVHILTTICFTNQ